MNCAHLPRGGISPTLRLEARRFHAPSKTEADTNLAMVGETSSRSCQAHLHSQNSFTICRWWGGEKPRSYLAGALWLYWKICPPRLMYDLKTAQERARSGTQGAAGGGVLARNTSTRWSTRVPGSKLSTPRLPAWHCAVLWYLWKRKRREEGRMSELSIRIEYIRTSEIHQDTSAGLI